MKRFSLASLVLFIFLVCCVLGLVANILQYRELWMIGLRGASVTANAAAYWCGLQGMIAGACLVLAAYSARRLKDI